MALTNEQIERLENRGFNRWQKGNLDRLYVNASQLGLECTRYNSGSISGATFSGEHISNSKASKMLNAKTYIDVATGIAYSDNDDLLEAVENIFAEI